MALITDISEAVLQPNVPWRGFRFGDIVTASLTITGEAERFSDATLEFIAVLEEITVDAQSTPGTATTQGNVVLSNPQRVTTHTARAVTLTEDTDARTATTRTYRYTCLLYTSPSPRDS